MKEHPIYRHITTDDKGNIYFDGRFIKGTVTRHGYRQYRVAGKSKLGHRLVAECILGRVLESSEIVNHKNLDKLDNTPENLEVGSQEDNIHHFWRNYGQIDDVEVEIVRPWKAGENHH